MDGLGITIGGEVVRVIDGDTIEIKVERVIAVRLLDCWAPETRTKDAKEKLAGIDSKKNMRREALGREVVLEIPIEENARFGESMSFGRVLGRVKRAEDGADLSQIQVAGGFATKERGE